MRCPPSLHIRTPAIFSLPPAHCHPHSAPVLFASKRTTSTIFRRLSNTILVTSNNLSFLPAQTLIFHLQSPYIIMQERDLQILFLPISLPPFSLSPTWLTPEWGKRFVCRIRSRTILRQNSKIFSENTYIFRPDSAYIIVRATFAAFDAFSLQFSFGSSPIVVLCHGGGNIFWGVLAPLPAISKFSKNFPTGTYILPRVHV